MFFKLLFLFSILCAVEKEPQETDTVLNSDSYYELVSELLESGNWNTALRVAIQGVVESKTDTIDPRLGIIALETATENEAEEFYSISSQAYIISMREADIEEHNDLIENQIRSIFPLLTDSERSGYDEKLKNRDPSVISDFIGFWEKKDPFPSTGLNERLIEHRLRILHARQNFTRASNTIYGTDDRADVYVRFGPPSRMTNETVALNSVSDPVSGEVVHFHGLMVVRAEIWSYDNFSDEEQIYVFGNRNGVGSYGLRSSVFELLPSHAIIELEDSRSLMTGQVDLRSMKRFITQLALIESLAMTHPYFSNLYNDYTSEIIRMNPGLDEPSFSIASRQFGDMFIQREERKSTERDFIAPSSLTSLLNSNNTIRTDVRKFNFFDELGDSEIFLVVQNRHEFVDIDHNDSNLKGILNVHEYDEDWNLINVSEQEIDIRRDFSSFSLELVPEDFSFLTYSLEAFVQIDQGSTFRPVASTGIREINKEVFDEYSTDQFRVSDLIFGRVNPEGTGRTTITPAFDRTFSGSEEVGVYFEVLSNIDEYFVSYRFERRNFLGQWQEVETSFSVTLEYQKRELRAQNWFEFNLQELRGGDYRLIMTYDSEESEPIIISEEFKVD